MAEEKVSIIYTVKDEASKAAAGIGNAFNKIRQNALAVGVGIVALVASFSSFLKATEGQEIATAKLNQALKNQGRFTAETSAEMEAYSSALQKVTTYGDEAITEVQAMLVAQGLHGEALKKATKATLDFAAANNMDLQSAGALMSKAAGGMTSALGRYGISATDASGKTLNFGQVIDKVNDKYGGFAESIANTPTGKLEQLKNAFGDLQELLGSIISTALVPMANWLLGLKDWFDKLSPSTQKFVGVVVVLGMVITGLLPVIAALVTSVGIIGAPVLGVVAAVALLVTGFVIFRKQVGAAIDFVKDSFISYLQIWISGVKLLISSLDMLIKKFNSIASKIPGMPKIDLGTDVALEKLDALNKKLENAKGNPETAKAKTDGNSDDSKKDTELQADNQGGEDPEAKKNQLIVDEEEKTLIAQAFDEKRLANKKAHQGQVDKIDKAMGKAYIDNVAEAAKQEQDIGKAAAQGALQFVKDQLLAEVKARAAKLAAEGFAELPFLAVGNPSGPLKLAAAGGIMAAGTSAINAIKLAQGGQFDVDSPTMVGPGVIAGEAGRERVTVQPLEKQGGSQEMRVIILDADGRTTLAKGMFKETRALQNTGELPSW